MWLLVSMHGCGDPASDGGAANDSGSTTSVDMTDTVGSSQGGGATMATDSAEGTSTDGTTSGVDSTGTGPGPSGNGGSFDWRVNEPNAHDYGRQLQIPPGFGEGEFTMQLWIRPDATFPVGPTDGDGILTNWSDADLEPYSGGSWWFRGNFLLDGHNNVSGFENGTFSLQWYGGGRVRWLFGDGAVVTGGIWSAGAWPATQTDSLLDDAWHHLTLVRRWSGKDDADLELWVDGALVNVATSPVRTDMRQYWDTWAGFGGAQDGWFWGAEKQAAVGKLGQYEDYKGLTAELRFWSRAMEGDEIGEVWDDAIVGDEPGLVGWFPWNEGAGTTACDVLDPGSCVELVSTVRSQWVEPGPPLQ